MALMPEHDGWTYVGDTCRIRQATADEEGDSTSTYPPGYRSERLVVEAKVPVILTEPPSRTQYPGMVAMCRGYAWHDISDARAALVAAQALAQHLARE